MCNRPAAPAITSVSPSRGPTAGGGVVRLFGNNFGRGNPNPSVQVADQNAAATWVSSSEVRITMVPGTGLNRRILVTVSERARERERERFLSCFFSKKRERILLLTLIILSVPLGWRFSLPLSRCVYLSY